MKNGQLKPAYNLQIGVEDEYIIVVYISDERVGQLTLIYFLYELESNIGKGYKYYIMADARYESEENYKYSSVKEKV